MPKYSSYNFCTLFDRHYLLRGLAMYFSLAKVLSNFKLWILCLDEDTEKVLAKLQLKNVFCLKLADIEDADLLQVKLQRSRAEYCWTLTPCLPWYILQKNPHLEHITYLDADLFFFANPEKIFAELQPKDDVLITEHRYFPIYSLQAEVYGKYNVQFMIFKNNENGRKILSWWRARCLEWCYARVEDGKFGDQKYLDDWTERFTGVHIMENIGGGIAPWNIRNHSLTKKSEQLLIAGEPLIFYHFHAFKLYHKYCMRPVGEYYLAPKVRWYIYHVYSKKLRAVNWLVKKYLPEFNYGWEKFSLRDYLKEKKLVVLKKIIYYKQQLWPKKS